MGTAGVDTARKAFARSRRNFVALAGQFVDDPDDVVSDAEARYEEMLPTMAYIDRPDAPMASAVFGCSASLALYLTLQGRGVDVHAFGRAMVEQMAQQATTWPDRNTGESEDDWSAFAAAGEESKRERRKGEFVFEVVNDEDGRTGMNILSCAICYQFSRYDAMALVPYMCATDDVVSDRYASGLSRTGTIAVGAHHCDFRYGGEPKHLAPQYPDRIRIPVRAE